MRHFYLLRSRASDKQIQLLIIRQFLISHHLKAVKFQQALKKSVLVEFCEQLNDATSDKQFQISQ